MTGRRSCGHSDLNTSIVIIIHKWQRRSTQMEMRGSVSDSLASCYAQGLDMFLVVAFR